MRRGFGLYGFLGWVLFIFIPSWGRELYARVFDYMITTFDHVWDSAWRLLLLLAALDIVITVARHFGLRYRKSWISLLIGITLGGLFQILLAIFVFGFEF